MDAAQGERLERCRGLFYGARRKADDLRERLGQGSLLVWNSEGERNGGASFLSRDAEEDYVGARGANWTVQESRFENDKKHKRTHTVVTDYGDGMDTGGISWEYILAQIPENNDDMMLALKENEKESWKEGDPDPQNYTFKRRNNTYRVRQYSNPQRPVLPWQPLDAWMAMDPLDDAKTYHLDMTNEASKKRLRLSAQRTRPGSIIEGYSVQRYGANDAWADTKHEPAILHGCRHCADPEALQWEDILLRMKELWGRGHEAGTGKRLATVHDVGVYRTPTATRSFWDFTVDGVGGERYRVLHCLQWPRAADAAPCAPAQKAPREGQGRAQGAHQKGTPVTFADKVRAPMSAKGPARDVGNNPWLNGVQTSALRPDQKISILRERNSVLLAGTACRYKGPHISLLGRMWSSKRPPSLSSTHKAFRLWSAQEVVPLASPAPGGAATGGRLAEQDVPDERQRDARTMVQLVCKDIFQEEFKVIPGYNNSDAW